MRILIASKRAPGTPGRRDGGVQTWIATVATELRRLGHSVDVVGAGDAPPATGYDLGIFANAGHTQPFMESCGRVLVVSHGIVPDEEPRWGDVWAFTSEEVSRHWQRNGRAFDPIWDHAIIRQPIDLEFWSPHSKSKNRKSTVVRYANRGGLEWLPEVAARLGLQFVHVRNATPTQARDMLRDAACVLASGRCAVEAMACGAPVVVCDDRPYQGPLMDIGSDAMRRNYSGRGGVTPTPDAMVAEVRKLWPLSGWREYAESHHDVRKVVPQLLEAACCTY